jgi:hypothetical protein
VQPIVQVFERLLPLRRKLIESVQPLLQVFLLLRRQTIERLLPLLGRHRLELFYGRPGAYLVGGAALPRGTHRMRPRHPAPPALRHCRRPKSNAHRQSSQSRNGAAAAHCFALNLFPRRGLLERGIYTDLLQHVHVIQRAFHLLDLKFGLCLLL